MVGPDVEVTALVRHSSRLFVTGANLRVPCFAILVRKVYGLGGIAMTGGSFKVNTFTVAWPTGEFGVMGLEGAVRLGYRASMEADPTTPRSAGATSTSRWPPSTARARPSAWPTPSPSTTPSTPPTRGSGWPT